MSSWVRVIIASFNNLDIIEFSPFHSKGGEMEEEAENPGISRRIRYTLGEIALFERINKLLKRGAVFTENVFSYDEKTKSNYYEIRLAKNGEIMRFRSERPFPRDANPLRPPSGK